MSFLSPQKMRCFCSLVVIFVLSPVLLVGQETSIPSRATSLDIVPESAAFYLASMNHAAIHDAIFQSNAYEQLLKSPVGTQMRKAYRKGRRRGWDQFGDNPFRSYLEGYSDSIGSAPGKITLSFLKQLFGNEVFLYAHDDWNRAEKAFNEMYAQLLPLISQLDSTGTGGLSEKIENVIREGLDGVQMPTVVFGTVLDDPQKIESLFGMAETFFESAMERSSESELIDRAYEVLRGDDYYLLTFQIHGEDLDWNRILEERPELAFLEDVFSDKSAAIAIGIKGPYLVATLGPSLEHVKTLGEGALLIDTPKLAHVKQAQSTHPIQSMVYVSDEMATAQRQNQLEMFDYLVSLGEVGMRSELDDHPAVDRLLVELKGDSQELKADLAEILPRPGAYLSFAYLHSEGIDGYTYHWGENRTLDDSKPLDLLQHVGPRPTLVVAAREKENLDQYAFVKKWGTKAFGYAESYLPDFVDDLQTREQVVAMIAGLKPILSRIGNATEEHLIPATKNCQTGLVLDFNSRREQWHPSMPNSGQLVPFPTFAIMVQISDKEGIQAAGTQYLESAREFLSLLKTQPELSIPDELEIPDPALSSVSGADRYAWPLPDEVELDESIVPHFLLSDEWLILSYSTDQSSSFLDEHTVPFWGPLSDVSEPRMAAVFFDHVAWLDAVEAWVDYGIAALKSSDQSLNLVNDSESVLLDFSEDQLLETLDRVFDFAKCFKGFASSSSMKEGVQVTHFQFRFQDIPSR